MFGPLPVLHRIILVLAALLVCAGLGVWAGLVHEVPVDVVSGVLAGLAAGLGTAYLIVHQHRDPGHPVRVVRRHR